MKKLISLLLLNVGLAASAGTFHFDSMLPPNAAGMIVPQNSTNLFGQSNVVWYYNAIQFPSVIGMGDFLVCNNTNNITNTYPFPPIGGTGYTNVFQVGGALPFYNNALWLKYGANALYVDKWSLTATNLTGGQLTGPALFDMPNFADYAAVVSSNQVVTVVAQGDIASATNALVLTLAASTDGSNYPSAGTWAQTYTMTLNGTNLLITNITLPNSWNLGTRTTRCISVGSTTNVAGATATTGGTNTYLQVLARGSWEP